MKKGILFLFCLLAFNIWGSSAGTYVLGVNQIDRFLKAIEKGTGDDVPTLSMTTDANTGQQTINTDYDQWENLPGLAYTVNSFVPTYYAGTSADNGSKWYGIKEINYANKGYNQIAGTQIQFEQIDTIPTHYSAIPDGYSSVNNYIDRNDLSWLETIDLSGNNLTDIVIDGGPYKTMPLKTFSIANNAHLENVTIKNCPNLTNVDITGCNLSFSKIDELMSQSNLPDNTFIYEFQGTCSFNYDAVDLTKLIEKNGIHTQIKSWSIQPTKKDGNIYSFSSNLIGKKIQVYLENSDYPNLVTSYDINLTNETSSNININSFLCNVKLDNLTTGNSNFSIGDEVLVTVYPYSCSIYDSFSIDGNRVDLNSNNQYRFVITKSSHQITAVFKKDNTPVGITSNYLRNGSFEYGLNLDWQYTIGQGDSATFKLEQGANAIDGNFALRVDINKMATKNSVFAQTHVSVGCDSLYLLHFWVSGSEESNLYMQIDGAEQSGIQYVLHKGANAYFYPFKIDKAKVNQDLTITFYFQDAVTKIKSQNPCNVTTNAGATYILDALELVDQHNNSNYDVYNTYIWNYNHKPNSEGKMWTAGDNSVSYDLPDGRKMWFFNDSFYGVMHPESNRLVDGGQFVRNAVVVENTDGTLSTFPVTNQGGQWAFFRVPDDALIYNSDGSVKNIFWVGDAIMEDNQIKVYLIEVYGQGRSYIGKFSYPDLKFLGVEKQENFCRTYETFFVENNKIYLYKTENEGDWGRYMHVARADLGDLSGKKGTWEFWNGTEWSKDSTQTARIYDMMADGVIRLQEGNYAHVSMPLMSPQVYVSFAPAPQGPWGNKTLVAVGDTSTNYWYYMPNFNGKLPNGKYEISFSANYNYCLFFCNSCDYSAFVDKYWYRPRSIQVDLLALSPYTKNPLDCAGVENGTATYDKCGICSGGTTGIEPCITGIAKIYSNNDFTGTGIGLNVGEYTAESLSSLGFNVSSLSSFNLDNGYVLELYSDDNFNGDMKEFENSVSNLSNESFGPVKSLIIRRKGIENLDGVFAIQNKQSQLFMTPNGNNTSNDVYIVQGVYNNAFQSFQLNNLGKGMYVLQNVGSGKSLNIINQSKDSKAFVEQWDGKEINIIFYGGQISSQYSDSPTGLEVTKLIDGSSSTKYLTFHNQAWVQFSAVSPYLLGRYTLTSANDNPSRDPYSWTVSGSNDGTNWSIIDTQTGITFTSRFQEKSFNVNSDASYSFYRFDIKCNSGSVLQFAELKLFGKVNFADGDYSDSQKFTIQDAGNGYVKIINKNSDLMLEITDGVTTIGAKVWQNYDYNQNGGLWKLIDASLLPNGVETIESNDNIIIFPNPATANLTVEAKQNETLKQIIVFDLNGKIVKSKQINDIKTVLSVSDLQKGFYLLKIDTDKGSYVRKLVKE